MMITWLFMEGENTLCSIIKADYATKKVSVKNYIEKNIYKAFGINEKPTWEDYEYFLGTRVMPKSQDELKYTLKTMGVDAYDPLWIIEKTEGRVAEDAQWLIRL